MAERLVTNGQRAVVCGLLLVGVGWYDACKIANVGHRTMRRYVAVDWRRLPVSRIEMTPEQRRRYDKVRQCESRHIAYAEAMR